MGKMKMGLVSFVSLVIILLSLELGICDVAANSTTLGGMCIQRERAALLTFKATLYIPEYSTLFPSWNSSNRDCCSWEAITCHRITGHVIALDLTLGNKEFFDNDMVAGTIDSSLLELKHLTYLDLSGIYFNYIKFPAYLGSLKQLQYLNLSNTPFSGVVPQNLGNLSSLRTLDLGWTFDLRVDDLMWASRLSSLEHLDMSGVNLSMATHVFEVLNTIPSLLFLSLSSSGLDNIHLPHSPINNSTLLANFQHLDLSLNSFSGEFPCFLIRNMTSLRYLDLSYNLLHGPIPTSIWNLSLLTNLAIQSNNLSGFIPASLGKLSALTNLYISSNKLSGEIPTCLGELTNLENIDISYNCFQTTLSVAHFAGLSKLVELGAASNNMIRFSVESDWMPPFQLKSLFLQSSEMGGQFPQWLQTQKALEQLDLSNCSITGTFPEWLQSLSSLILLNLSRNNISGPIPEFSSSNMIFLDLSENIITHLPFNIGHMLPHLEFLILARNLINNTIPDSICQITNLTILDLFNNRFSGNLPNCWSSSKELMVASFSSNELTGVIPNSIGEARSLVRLRLNGNRFTGQLPSTLKNCKKLDLLDVGGNNLSGKIPQWIGKHLLQLRFLILRDNDFSGTIPREMCRLSELQVLDIANNNLTGNVPHCFAFFSGMMLNRKLMADNGSMLSEGLSQVIKGVELKYTTNYFYVVNMDLSSNHLVGEIPWELTNLSGLIGLNLSHNHLKGHIPAKIGDMKSLESLDLSNNNLQGIIPYTLSSLSFLSKLNLSNNNLSGQIPGGRQLQTLDDPASIYQGNPLLCGAPLQRKCDETQDAENHEAVDEDRADRIWFYGIITAGFATGFWAVIGVMVVKTKWRQTYFRCIEVAMAKMLGY